MKQPTKVLLGLATVWPIFYIFIFFGFIFSMLIFVPDASAPHRGFPLMPFSFVALFAMHFITIIGGLALTVFYVVNIFKNNRLDQNQKLMWALLSFFAGLFALPVYWYLYIWKDSAQALPASDAPRSLNESSSWANQSTGSEREKEYVSPRQHPDWR